MKESKIIVGGIVLIAIAGGIYLYSKKQIPYQKTPPIKHPTPKTSTILNTQPITATSNTQQVLGTSAVTKNIPEDPQSKLLAESNTTVTQTNNNPTYVPPATSPITKPEEKPPIPIFVSPPTNVSPPKTNILSNNCSNGALKLVLDNQILDTIDPIFNAIVQTNDNFFLSHNSPENAIEITDPANTNRKCKVYFEFVGKYGIINPPDIPNTIRIEHRGFNSSDPSLFYYTYYKPVLEGYEIQQPQQTWQYNDEDWAKEMGLTQYYHPDNPINELTKQLGYTPANMIVTDNSIIYWDKNNVKQVFYFVKGG